MPINYCRCNNEKCSSCPNISLVDDDLCSECNSGNNYYSMEDDSDYYGFKKCYKDPIGYYLDTDNNTNIYKKCFYSCRKCNIKGDNITHNCIECDNNYPMGFKINDYYNCYPNCTYYYYFDNDNNYHCTDDNTCPNEFPMLVKNECKKSNANEIKEIINNLNNNENTKRRRNKLL